MIRFLMKGLLRDRHRSLFPILIVSFGVFLTTVLYSFISGELNDLIDSNARFDTGHLKITTRMYNTLASQMPNDLAIAGTEKLMLSLKNKYPEYDWTARIKYVGLLDSPDKNGETQAQNSIFGLAVNLLDAHSMEGERLNLRKSLVRGRMPEKPRETLISEEFAKRMNTGIGHPITLLSTTSSGAMAVQNFIVCGTVKFGVAAMDRGAMITDISDIQFTLEMPDRASEILGFNKNKFYEPADAEKIKMDFNDLFTRPDNQYSPLMVTLEDQNGLGEYLDYINTVGLIIVGIFLAAMSVVLLNTGLMSGIRRYGEIGVRLALGEAKNRIYQSILYESVLIGFTGSVIGTGFGLAVALYLQEFGIDITETLRSSSIMMSNIIRARVSITSVYIGFIPGLLATLIGTAFSGIQIFQRQTASLFKELEA